MNETELNKILCSGCRDGLPLTGRLEPVHMWIDGCGMEPCTATAERKEQLRNYFAKELQETGI